MNTLLTKVLKKKNFVTSLRKITVYTLIFSLLWQNCVWAVGGIHILEEDLGGARTRIHAQGRIGIVEPGSVKNNTVHNVFEDLQLLPGGGIVFKVTPDTTKIYNRIYNENPIYLSGVIEADQATSMVFANSGGITLESPDFQHTHDLTLIAGSLAQTNKGMAYGVDQGILSLNQTFFEEQGDVKFLSLAGREIHIQQSLLSPSESISFTAGQHIKGLERGQRFRETLESSSPSQNAIHLDVSTILRSKGIFLESLEEGAAIHARGLLQSADEDIIIRARGDIYLDKIIAHRNLHIETTGKVFFGNQTLVGGSVSVKAENINIDKELSSIGRLYLKASQNLEVKGILGSKDNMSLIGQNAIDLKGKITSQGTFTAASKGIISQEGSLSSEDSLRIKGQSFIKNGNLISQSFLKISTEGDIDNQWGDITSSSWSKFSSKSGKILNAGRIFGEGSITVDAKYAQNNGQICTKDILKTNEKFFNKEDGSIEAKTLSHSLAVLSQNLGKIEVQDDIKFQSTATVLKGSVKTHGRIEASGEELSIEGQISAENGFFCNNLNKLTNKGIFFAFGGGLQGRLTEFENEGKVDLSSVNAWIGRSTNKKGSVIRTADHHILQGNHFFNYGTVFTCGVHQTKLSGTYKDNGTFYSPTLFLLEARSINYTDFHRSFLKDAVISATYEFTAGKGVSFSLEGNQAACFLQLSSGGDLTYNGAIRQFSSSTTGFPLLEYFKIFNQTPILYKDFVKRIFSLHLGPWKSIRNPLKSGITLQAARDINCTKSIISQDSGSVGLDAGGKAYVDGAAINAGYFKSNNASIKSTAALLKGAKLSSLFGNASIFCQDTIVLDDSHIFGGQSAWIASHSAHLKNSHLEGIGGISLAHSYLTMEKSQIVSSEGSSTVQAGKSAKITDSTILARLLASVIGEDVFFDSSTLTSQENSVRLEAANSAKITDSTILARLLSSISGKDISFNSSTLTSQENSVRLEAANSAKITDSMILARLLASVVGKEVSFYSSTLESQEDIAHIAATRLARIVQSSLRGKTTVADGGENLILSQSNFEGLYNRFKADNINTRITTIDGPAVFVASNNLQIHNLQAHDAVAAFAQTISCSGTNTADSVQAQGKHIKIDGTLFVEKFLSVIGETVEQLGTTRAGENSHIEATESYIDTVTSRNEAGDVLSILAGNTKGFMGNQKAGKLLSLEFQDMNLLNLLNQTEAPITEAHLKEAEISFNEDFILDRTLHLWAKRLENKAKFTATKDFIAHIQTTIMNQGSMDIHGKGFLEGKQGITTRNIKARQGLGLKTDALFTLKGTADGGQGALSVDAGRIDADAVGRSVSTFAGTGVYLNSLGEILARGGRILSQGDAQILGQGDVNFDAVSYNAGNRTRYLSALYQVNGNMNIQTSGRYIGRALHASVGGDVFLKADQGVNLDSLASVYEAERWSYRTGWFNQNRHYGFREEAEFFRTDIASNGKVYVWSPKGDISAKGASFFGAEAITLDALGKVDLGALKAKVRHYSYDESGVWRGFLGSIDERSGSTERAQTLQAVSNRSIGIFSRQSTIESDAPYFRAPELELYGERGVFFRPLTIHTEEEHQHSYFTLSISPLSLGFEYGKQDTQTKLDKEYAGTLQVNHLKVGTGEGAEAQFTTNITGVTPGDKTDITVDTDKITFSGTKNKLESTTDGLKIGISIDVSLMPGGSFDVSHDEVKKTTHAATLQNFGRFTNKRKGTKLIVQGGAHTSIETTLGEDMEALVDHNAQDKESQSGYGFGASLSATSIGAHGSVKGGEKTSSDHLTGLNIKQSMNRILLTDISHEEQVKDDRWGVGAGFSLSDKGASASFHIQQGENKFGATIPLDMNPFDLKLPTDLQSLNELTGQLSYLNNTLNELGVNTGGLGEALNTVHRGTQLATQATGLIGHARSFSTSDSPLKMLGTTIETLGRANQLAREVGIDTGPLGETLEGVYSAATSIKNTGAFLSGVAETRRAQKASAEKVTTSEFNIVPITIESPENDFEYDSRSTNNNSETHKDKNDKSTAVQKAIGKIQAKPTIQENSGNSKEKTSKHETSSSVPEKPHSTDNLSIWKEERKQKKNPEKRMSYPNKEDNQTCNPTQQTCVNGSDQQNKEALPSKEERNKERIRKANALFSPLRQAEEYFHTSENIQKTARGAEVAGELAALVVACVGPQAALPTCWITAAAVAANESGLTGKLAEKVFGASEQFIAKGIDRTFPGADPKDSKEFSHGIMASAGLIFTTKGLGGKGAEKVAQHQTLPKTTNNNFSASSPMAAKTLTRKLSALESAQKNAEFTKTLSDGRSRYYDTFRSAKKEGLTAGSRYVTEYNPQTGQVRDWIENYTKEGNVNRVHPKMIDGNTLNTGHYPPTAKELGIDKK